MSTSSSVLFETFDWLNEPRWIEYQRNLTFIGTEDEESTLHLIKQKWFKRHINPDYVITNPADKIQQSSAADETNNSKTIPNTPLCSSPNQHCSSSTADCSGSRQANATESGCKSKFPSTQEKGSAQGPSTQKPFAHLFRVSILATNLSILLHSFFFLLNTFYSIFLGNAHYNLAFLCGFISYALCLFRAVGKPKMSTQYLAEAMKNQCSNHIVYCLTFLVGKPNLIALFPLAIYAYINVMLLLPVEAERYGINLKTVRIFKKIRSDKMKLLIYASSIEVLILFTLITRLISRDPSAIIQILMFWNFLVHSYRNSPLTRDSTRALKSIADGYLLSPNSPELVKYAYGKLVHFVRVASGVKNSYSAMN